MKPRRNTKRKSVSERKNVNQMIKSMSEIQAHGLISNQNHSRLRKFHLLSALTHLAKTDALLRSK